MIHEFIDHKKRAKNVGSSNEKTLGDSIETCSVEQSVSESTSTAFIPPWLRNNLGLKVRNNHMYGVFDNRTEKLRPEIKNQTQYEQNEGEEMKSNIDEGNPKKTCYFENPKKAYDEDSLVHTPDSYRKVTPAEKQSRQENVNEIPVIWQAKPKAELQSSSTDSETSPPSLRRNFKTTESEMSARTQTDMKQIKSEEKKRQKTPKKKNRVKHRIASGLEEIDLDALLEEKAKEILDNYAKKKVHSAASDIKRFQAKLILLHTKISLGKLGPEDLRLLREVKAQTGSKENFDKLMRHIREVNLKEILENRSSILKSMHTSKDEESTKTQQKEEERTLVSTDDENKIKRFSELLRKNQNEEEKKKCLEEVRNYFDRKRRTRLTKCWTLNSYSKESGVDGQEDLKNDRTSLETTFSEKTAADWRSKVRISDAEVVKKAGDGTLQKFVELYNFHVSPSLMNSTKNNVLKDIHTHSFEDESPVTRHGDILHNVEGSSLMRKDARVLKKEQMKRLKNELEYYINNAREDVSRLKVQSIILKEESKSLEFTYSFTTWSLERKRSELVANVMTTLSLKEVEVQAGKTSTLTNVTTQTKNLMTACEKGIQTEKNSQKSEDTQTDGTYAVELNMLRESDVSTGLYRMVRSKQAGRFYLYPEIEERSNNTPETGEEHKKSDTSEEEKLREKEWIGTSEDSETDTKERETDVSEVLIVDGVGSKKEADSSRACGKKQESFWLWDGEKIDSSMDLKAHVESLLKEKLKEMNCGLPESGKDKFSCKILPRHFPKAHRTASQDDSRNFAVLHPTFPLINEDLELKHEDKLRNFGEESAGTQSLGEPVLPTSEEKLVKDASTQNSAFLSLNIKPGKSSGKSQQSSKISYLGKKRKIKVKRNWQSRRSIADLKMAMQLMNECLFNKRMKLEVDSSPKDSVCCSGTTLEDNTSSYSKDTSDDRVTMIFGLKDDLNCKNKNNRKMVSEHVQTNIGNNLSMKKAVESQRMDNHMHRELIERILQRVNHKERESLWNDMRKLIKSKLGKDIDNENAKEMCIQIEQDVQGTSEGKGKHLVLAKGYYVRNEGDVEVEIDLTLKDLERIIRRRERNRRRQGLRYRRNSRSLKSSSGQSGSNFQCLAVPEYPEECFKTRLASWRF